MKTFFYIGFLLVFLLPGLWAQQDSIAPPVLKKKDNFSVSMGTSFGSFGGQSFSSSYINPSMSQQVNSKLRMTSGLVLFNNSFASVPGNPRGGNGYGNGVVYLEGTYKMNKKLTVSAGGFTNMNNGGPNTNINFYNNMDRMNGIGFGFHYMLNEKVSIGGSFNFRNGGYPGYSPYGYYNSGYNNLFFNHYSPYYSAFGW